MNMLQKSRDHDVLLYMRSIKFKYNQYTIQVNLHSFRKYKAIEHTLSYNVRYYATSLEMKFHIMGTFDIP